MTYKPLYITLVLLFGGSAVATIVGAQQNGIPAHSYEAGFCHDASCVPNRGNFGYYQTGWRRWPTARPVFSPTGERNRAPIDLPAADTPLPENEGNIDSPPPRANERIPSPSPEQDESSTPALPLPEPDVVSPALPAFETPVEPPPVDLEPLDLGQAPIQSPATPRFSVVANSPPPRHDVSPQRAAFNQNPADLDAQHDLPQENEQPLRIKPVVWQNPFRDARSPRAKPNAMPTGPSEDEPKLPPRKLEPPREVTRLPKPAVENQPGQQESDSPSLATGQSPAHVTAAAWSEPKPVVEARNPLRRMASKAMPADNPLRATDTAVRPEGENRATLLRNPLR